MNIKSPSSILYLTLCCVTAGILVGAAAVGALLYIYVLVAALLAMGIYRLYDGTHVFLFGVLVVSLVSLGVLRYDISITRFSDVLPGGQVVGRVITNPAQTAYGSSFLLETTDRQRTTVRFSSMTHIEYGTVLDMTLECERPESFETDMGMTFDYARYLRKDHVYSVCKTEQVTGLLENKSIKRGLYRFANSLSDEIERLFKAPHAGFVGGVLVGDKSNLDSDLRNDFIKTGTIHVLALSGFNIAIVALFFQRFFALLLPRRLALVLAGLGVIVFVAMTGFSASAVHAGIMAVIIIIAGLSYERYDALRALLVASLLMILYDPMYLLYDSSFHLSFLATAGIVILTPLLEIKFSWISFKPVRIGFTTTLAAFIATFPYLMYFFEGISFSGVVVNILIMPGIPLLMLLSFVALLMSVVSLSFAHLAVLFSEWVSQATLYIVHLFAQIPWGYMSVSIPWWICLGIYGVIGYGVYLLKKREEK